MQKIEEIEISKLHLWTENPRDPVSKKYSDKDIILAALEDKNHKWDLLKILSELKDGYYFSDILTVVKNLDDYTVYDGNRRLIILKYLQNIDDYKDSQFKLNIKLEDKILTSLKTIPCNLCDKETALKIVEHKHSHSGSWKQLERDMFDYYQRNNAKSIFLIFDECTKMISDNPWMNQDFIKKEILTEKNLKNIGFAIKNDKLISIYPQEDGQNILNYISEAVKNKKITTRGENRGDLKTLLLSIYEDLNSIIKPFIETCKIYETKPNNLKLETENETKNIIPVKTPNENQLYLYGQEPKTGLRRTSAEKINNILFGEKLYLESGKVNNLYMAIDKIYNKFKSDDTVLPIIGMSLRLLLECAAREKDTKYENGDQVYTTFLHEAKNTLKKSNQNYLSLTSDWLDKKNNLEALLGKYAHGNINVSRNDVLNSSKIIGDILKFYFAKKAGQVPENKA